MFAKTIHIKYGTYNKYKVLSAEINVDLLTKNAYFNIYVIKKKLSIYWNLYFLPPKFELINNHNIWYTDSENDSFKILFLEYFDIFDEKNDFKFIIPNNKYNIGHTIPKTYPGGCQSALYSSLPKSDNPDIVKGKENIKWEKDINNILNCSKYITNKFKLFFI